MTSGYIHRSVYNEAKTRGGVFTAREVYESLTEQSTAPYTLDQVRRALYYMAARRNSEFVTVRPATYRWEPPRG